MAKRKFLVPQDIGQVARLLHDIAKKQERLAITQADKERKISEIRAEADRKVKPLQEALRKLFYGIYVFSAENRDTLLGNGKLRSFRVWAGKVGWRKKRYSVRLRDEKKAIAELKKRGMEEYIRRVEVVNKEALLRDKKKVEELGLRNISFDGGEVFYVDPKGCNTSCIAKLSEDLKKKL